MNHLATTAFASASFDEQSPVAINCFGGSIDIDELLSLFRDNGLQIASEHGEAALQTCANFEYSKCTQEEFLNVMKEYCSVHRQVDSLAAVAAGVVPVAGAAFGLILALVKVSNSIKDRAKAARDKVKAAELRARYLRGLATADNLSVEATNIAIVMHELINRGFDDFETTQLSSSSVATIQLLREDLLPYLKSLNGKEPGEVKLFELRQKRWELKQRLIRQFEIVHVHQTRVEQGLAELRSGTPTYYVKMNRLMAFARECLLEIHLRAWYAMMGYFDSDNTMIEHDDRNVEQAASERIGQIQRFFEIYAEARFSLLKYKYESKRDVKGPSKHDHMVTLRDDGAESDLIVPKLSVKSLMIKANISPREPEGGGIDHFPDGSCEIWNDTVFSGADRCSDLGKFVDSSIKRYVVDQLRVDGPVWSSSLGFVDRIRRAIAPTLPQRPKWGQSWTAPATIPYSRGSISTPSRIPMVQGASEETHSPMPAAQSGYAYSLPDSASVTSHHYD